MASAGRGSEGNVDCPCKWLVVVLDNCNLLICLVCVCVFARVYVYLHERLCQHVARQLIWCNALWEHFQ